jgi:hypothetical protein
MFQQPQTDALPVQYRPVVVYACCYCVPDCRLAFRMSGNESHVARTAERFNKRRITYVLV